MANLSIQDAVYPAGVARVEPLGVIVCAVLMVLASVEVVRKSFSTIIQFYGSDDGPPMDFDEDTGILITVVILLKIALWRWCMYASEKSSNVSLEAIGLDNQNDVLSNTAALVSAILAKSNPSWWWADPLGAIIISVYIVWTWIETATEQINMLVGKAADPEFLDYVREIAENHDPDADLDTVRAYHFGPKFIVEIELVMNKNTPLDISHDVGMLLQHRIELLPQCERCFVHIDYQHRENDDHDKNISVRDKVNVSRDWLETKESNGPKNNDGDDMV
jgi:cation diffusion facilitator family transporter